MKPSPSVLEMSRHLVFEAFAYCEQHGIASSDMGEAFSRAHADWIATQHQKDLPQVTAVNHARKFRALLRKRIDAYAAHGNHKSTRYVRPGVH